MKNIVLGADIGGSHITAALIDLNTGGLLRETIKRQPVNSHGSPDEILNSWANSIADSFMNYSGPKRIGIAMPGPFDYQKGISYIKGFHKYDSLYKLNVKEALAERLNIESNAILLKNDAACFLQGEIFAGAAKGYRKSIGFTLGTGFGSAIGIDAVAQDAEYWSRPFLEGVAEDYFSTKWFLKRYKELSGKSVANVRELTALVKDCSYVTQVFDEFSANLIRFSEEIYSVHAPEVIVLGGNISRAKDLFLDKIINYFKQKHASLAIRISDLGEESAIVGGASLWKQKELVSLVS